MAVYAEADSGRTKKSPRRKTAGESRYHLLSEAAVGPEDYLHVELLAVPQDGQGHGVADDVAAPEPPDTSTTWTWVPPPSFSTVVTVMPREGAPR